jgi:hypothetical protein
MVKPPKRPPAGSRDDLPYLPGDAIPVPDVDEKNTETTWALFSELSAKDDRRYAETVQVTVPGSTQPLARPTNQPGTPDNRPVLEKLMAQSTQQNRVCPVAPVWQELCDALRAKAPKGAAPSFAPPLVGADWPRTSSLAKRMIFKDQIGWSAAHGLADDMYRFLARLSETQWHHMGD